MSAPQSTPAPQPVPLPAPQVPSAEQLRANVENLNGQIAANLGGPR